MPTSRLKQVNKSPRVPATASKETKTAAVPTNDGTYGIPSLAFDETLSWRAGRAISVADLLSRLQHLHDELRTTDQEQFAPQRLHPGTRKLATDLAHANLLGHKDKGIRALAVACVVDLLRVCAPDAPFSDHQLSDIFTVVTHSILRHYGEQQNAWHTIHNYIIDNLVETSAIVLIADIPERTGGKTGTLVEDLFKTTFDLVSSSSGEKDGLNKTQEVLLQRMLCEVIDQTDITESIVDIIISQFLRIDPRGSQKAEDGSAKKKSTKERDKFKHSSGKQATLLLKDFPPAYNLSRVICNHAADRLVNNLRTYFNTIITNAGAALNENGGMNGQSKRASSAESDEDEEETLSDLRKAHKLVRELWRACPDVLAGVIPQLEIEFAANSEGLRQIAVATIGDIISGIGIAGLPDLSKLDPAAFPLPSMSEAEEDAFAESVILRPHAPKPFPQMYSHVYQSFLGRTIDKSATVRIAWTQAASRILLTRAGGNNLNPDEQAHLLKAYAQALRDTDERVRLAALEGLEHFSYQGVIEILGSDGGLSKGNTLLSVATERILDKKSQIRETAMTLLASIWGVASRDIANGDERVRSLVGSIPSRIIPTLVMKDASVSCLGSQVLYENLLPITYPPLKGKSLPTSQVDSGADSDTIRAHRILSLIRDLDQKSKLIFFGIQKRQKDVAKGVNQYLETCEQYNGGVMDNSVIDKSTTDKLKSITTGLAALQADSARANSDLMRFAKAHERRLYQLIRFAMDPESDYKTVSKALKELAKKISESSKSSSTTPETIDTLMRQCALICFNKSHVPAIMEAARSSDHLFSEPAQEVLKEISNNVPEVLKSHIQELCQELEMLKPSEGELDTGTVTDSMKACAAFARRYPQDVSKERKFQEALLGFTLHTTSPKTAKHAITILLSTSDKKDLHVRDIVNKIVKHYDSTSQTAPARLSALSQICLIAGSAASAFEDDLLGVTMVKTLHKNHTPDSGDYDEKLWPGESGEPDAETLCKKYALNVLTNRCRSDKRTDLAAHDALVKSVLDLLVSIIVQDGEIAPSKDTPSKQRNYLRLAAARSLVKLCRHVSRAEELLAPKQFESIALLITKPPFPVRSGLVGSIKKHLSQNRLQPRWLVPLFLVAFEPEDNLIDSTTSFLKSRVEYYNNLAKRHAQTNGIVDAKTSQSQKVIENALPRLLSLLAHHHDFPPLNNSEDSSGDLLDFSRYIVYYLRTVATEDNLSLIFHLAQRVKQTEDALIDEDELTQNSSVTLSELKSRLYVLSDLACATISAYADLLPAHEKRGMNLLQAIPGSARLPGSLFRAIKGSAAAQEIASKNYLPEDVSESLPHLVRSVVRGANRKAKTKSANGTSAKEKRRIGSVAQDDEDESGDDTNQRSSKKRRTSTLPDRSTPKSHKKRKADSELTVEQPSRKSARTSVAHTSRYIEADSDEDPQEGDEDVVAYKPNAMSSAVGPKSGATSSARKKRKYAGYAFVDKDGNEVDEEEINQDLQTESGDDEGDQEGADHEPGPQLASSPLKRKDAKKQNHQDVSRRPAERRSRRSRTEAEAETADEELTEDPKEAEVEVHEDEDTAMQDDSVPQAELEGEDATVKPAKKKTTPLKENGNRRRPSRKQTKPAQEDEDNDEELPEENGHLEEETEAGEEQLLTEKPAAKKNRPHVADVQSKRKDKIKNKVGKSSPVAAATKVRTSRRTKA